MGTPLRVLMIEDSEDDAVLLQRELRRGGYDVEFERVDLPGTLKSALDTHAWDLIVSDFSMPHFSGTDALRLLRAEGSDVPFIFVSGTMGEETAVAALQNGAQDYLMKTNLKRLVPALNRGDQPLQVGLHQVILGAILQGSHGGFLAHRARNKNEGHVGSLCSQNPQCICAGKMRHGKIGDNQVSVLCIQSGFQRVGKVHAFKRNVVAAALQFPQQQGGVI